MEPEPMELMETVAVERTYKSWQYSKCAINPHVIKGDEAERGLH